MTTEDGLSQSTVQDIIQDHFGFIWIATQDGLNKFDGKKFVVFNTSSDHTIQLPVNWVTTLYEDSRQRLWIGTEGGGVCYFDRRKNTFKSFTNIQNDSLSLTGKSVWSITEDYKGRIWIGTMDNGFSLFNEKDETFTSFTVQKYSANGMPGNAIRSIFSDSQGRLWIGTFGTGLTIFDPDLFTFKTFTNNPENPESLSSNTVRVIYEDLQKNIWVGTANGVNKLEKSGKFIRYSNDPSNPLSIKGNDVRDIVDKDEKSLWIATLDGGLNLFEKEKNRFSAFVNDPNDNNSIASDKILNLYQDKTGILWIGTMNVGVIQLLPSKKFYHLGYDASTKRTLVDKHVLTITTDKDNEKWIGTSNGITRIIPDAKGDIFSNESTFIHYSNEIAGNKIPLSYITSLCADKNGNIWIGTLAGLAIYSKKNNRLTVHTSTEKSEHGLLSNNIMTIYEDKKSDIWIGTSNGLNKVISYENGILKLQQFKSVAEDSTTLSSGLVSELYEDSRGNLWVGTFGGLNLMTRSDDKFKRFLFQPGVTGTPGFNIISSFAEDSKGNFWVGGSGGLSRYDYDKQVFVNLNVNDGLPNNLVFGMARDNDGFIWLTTNYGISKFDPLNLTFTNYDKLDGLQANEFNDNALEFDSSGKIFAGGVNGITYFNPREITASEFISNIQITSLIIRDRVVENYQDLSFLKSIKLQPGEKSFQVEFVAINFTSPKKLKYAYMLEGFDNNWNYTGARNFASYTNLPGGSYTLRIRVTNTDGLWAGSEFTFPVVIETYFYEKPVIQALSSFIFLGIISLVFVRRMRIIRERNLHLKKINAELESNIDQRIKTERLLIAARDRAEDLNRIKTNFLANMSHELRTPLVGILGYAEILKDEIKERTSGEMIDSIHYSGTRLLTTLNSLLDIKKIEENRMMINPATFDLIQEMKHITTIFQGSASQKEILLTTDFKSSTLHIVSDRNLINHIVTNLVNNALKFTEAGFVNVSVDLIEKNIREYICIKVTDTGIGISEKDRALIFEEFRQASEGLSRNFEGTGLGLTIAKRYAELLEGEIVLESEVDKGSAFTLIFPYVKPKEPEEHVANTSTDKYFFGKRLAENEKLKVLVVENDPISQEVVRLYLRNQCRIDFATTGIEAIEKANFTNYSIILMDINLGSGVDGVETTKEIRSLPGYENTPIIAITAYALPDDKKYFLEAGCTLYLSKPFTRKELVNIVAMAAFKSSINDKELT